MLLVDVFMRNMESNLREKRRRLEPINRRTTMERVTVERVCQFYWRNIICRFGLPWVIVSDNGVQFASVFVVEFYKNLRIQNQFISIEHPQANSRAEAVNKIILSG